MKDPDVNIWQSLQKNFALMFSVYGHLSNVVLSHYGQIYGYSTPGKEENRST
jgi:hypothetical protein